MCKMTVRGEYNFEERIGVFTGDHNIGRGGDLIVWEPIIGQVYGYGQKDYRGGNTEKHWAKWDGEKFVSCDKLGREKE